MLNCGAMDIQRREFISLGAAGAALAACAAKPATPIEQADFRYGLTRVNDVLAKECARRGITQRCAVRYMRFAFSSGRKITTFPFSWRNAFMPSKHSWP